MDDTAQFSKAIECCNIHVIYHDIQQKNTQHEVDYHDK